jgi:hypothetical protein
VENGKMSGKQCTRRIEKKRESIALKKRSYKVKC